MEELAVTIGSEVEIQSPRSSPQPDDSVLLEAPPRVAVEGAEEGEGGGGEEGEGVGGEEGGGGGGDKEDDVGVPDRLQRFYFESDALVLKNNIE